MKASKVLVAAAAVLGVGLAPRAGLPEVAHAACGRFHEVASGDFGPFGRTGHWAALVKDCNNSHWTYVVASSSLGFTTACVDTTCGGGAAKAKSPTLSYRGQKSRTANGIGGYSSYSQRY